MDFLLAIPDKREISLHKSTVLVGSESKNTKEQPPLAKLLMHFVMWGEGCAGQQAAPGLVLLQQSGVPSLVPHKDL